FRTDFARAHREALPLPHCSEWIGVDTVHHLRHLPTALRHGFRPYSWTFLHHRGAVVECCVYGVPWGRPACLPRCSPAVAGWHRLGGVSPTGRGGGWDREWSTPGVGDCGVYVRWESRVCRWSTGDYRRRAFLRPGPELLHHRARAAGRPGTAGV